MEKRFNFINKLNKREKHLIFLLIGLIVFWCLYQIYCPRLHIFRKRKEQLKQIKQISYEYNRQHTKKYLGKQIPSKNNISDFIVLLEKICEKNQVKIISISSYDEIQESIRFLPVTIKFEGDLDNIISFIDDLINCERALKVKNINLNTKQNVSSVKWVMSVTLNLYYQPYM